MKHSSEVNYENSITYDLAIKKSTSLTIVDFFFL